MKKYLAIDETALCWIPGIRITRCFACCYLNPISQTRSFIILLVHSNFCTTINETFDVTADESNKSKWIFKI